MLARSQQQQLGMMMMTDKSDMHGNPNIRPWSSSQRKALPGNGCITNGNRPNFPLTRPKLAPTKQAPIKSPPTKPLMTLAKPAPTSVRSAPMKPLKPLKVPAKPLASP